MNLKSSLLVVLLTATAGANASILNLTGKDVIYSINTDADWFQGLVASVTGDTLTFKNADGSNYLDAGIKGRVNNSYVAVDAPNFGDVTVTGRNGKKINGIGSTMDASIDASVTGKNPWYSGAVGNSVAGYWGTSGYLGTAYSWATAYANDVSGKKVTISTSDAQGWTGSGYNTLSAWTNNASFSQLASSVNLIFGAYAYFEKYGTGTVDAHITDFGVTTSVAPVPEPETYALMGLGLVGLLVARRRKVV